MTNNWQEKIKGFCDHFNIPLEYLSNTIYEPKVIPMIRGKAFEFSVMLKLMSILPEADWEVSHPTLNAQLGSHDVDVLVVHKQSGKEIRIECKLSKKGSYRVFKDKHHEIRVKCMRSRTLGEEMIKKLAPQLGKSQKQLKVHNDQYLPNDFDFVATSIGNAFYETNDSSGLFEWDPSSEGIEFLNTISGNQDNLKDFAFNSIYIACSSDIYVGASGVECTRRNCTKKRSCGFIPNYPIIHFKKDETEPSNKWLSIEDSEREFSNYIT